MAIRTIPSHDDLTTFVSSYDLGALARAEGIEAGTVNTSYVLELGSGRFFLRIYEEQDAIGAAREAGVLAHLARAGVLTPAPLVGRDGRSTRTVAGKPAALFPWVEGEQICQRGVTPEAAEVVGAALARIHVAGHAPDTPLDAGRFDPAHLLERCERVSRSPDPDARAAAEGLHAAVMDVAARRRPDAPSGLVHGDLFRDNVLWERPSGACRIAALLDFESAHDGPFAFDLAVTILSWSYGSELDPRIAGAIVRGYRSVRELTPADRDALYDETILAALRFTITRITDDAIRVGKRWQRFVERRAAVERLGRAGFLEVLGL
jgi:homoserine kinase type II